MYRHIRLDKNEPFYIGVATKPKRYTTHKSEFLRAYQTIKTGRGEIWQRIIKKTDYDVEILYESNDYKEVLKKEVEFVLFYGRLNIKTGTLANLTVGGLGMTGYKHSDESRKRMSLGMKGRIVTPETMAKRIKTRQENGYRVSDEHKRKMSEKMKGNKNSLGTKLSDESKRKISDRNKIRFAKKGEWDRVFGKSKYKPTFCFSENGELLFSFKSLNEACEKMNKDRSAVLDNIKGQTKYSTIIHNNTKIKVTWKH